MLRLPAFILTVHNAAVIPSSKVARMSEQAFVPSRRRFFGQLAATAAAVATLTQADRAFAAPLPELSESDPTGAALGYKADSTKVDTVKYPNFKPDQVCARCNLVQGTDAEPLRPCTIFPGKSVRSKGWCAAYVPKPA